MARQFNGATDRDRPSLEAGGFLVVTGENAWSIDRIFDPVLNPLLTPAKRFVRRVVKELDKSPRCYARSVRQHEYALNTNGLVAVRKLTFGFGPFSFLGKRLFANSTAIKLNDRLQGLAAAKWPVIPSIGHVYVGVARKPDTAPK